MIAAAANVVGAAAVTSRSQWSLTELDKLIALSAGHDLGVPPRSDPRSGCRSRCERRLIVLLGYVLVH